MASPMNILQGLANQSNVPTDDVPAQLTQNEFVIPADVVIALGEGDSDKGSKLLQHIVDTVRAQTKGHLASVASKNGMEPENEMEDLQEGEMED